jgi:hypothetical protein
MNNVYFPFPISNNTILQSFLQENHFILCSPDKNGMLILFFLTMQPVHSSCISPLLLEQLQLVLPLTLLNRGDEPHDDVERQQDSTSPEQVYRQEAEGVLVCSSDRHDSDEMPQQQNSRELHEQADKIQSFRQHTLHLHCTYLNLTTWFQTFQFLSKSRTVTATDLHQVALLPAAPAHSA